MEDSRRARLPVFSETGLVTDGWVQRLREKRDGGEDAGAAAAAAGMNERTARREQSGALPSTAKAPRAWPTREDLELVPRRASEVPHSLVQDGGWNMGTPAALWGESQVIVGAIGRAVVEGQGRRR